MLTARLVARGLVLIARMDRLIEYNDDIQRQLQQSSFADSL